MNFMQISSTADSRSLHFISQMGDNAGTVVNNIHARHHNQLHRRLGEGPYRGRMVIKENFDQL